MHRFYAPDIETQNILPEEESQHAIRVLRLTPGEPIEVIDGKGNLFLCKIADSHPKRCAVDILEVVKQPSHWGCEIVVGIAPTKNIDRTEWMLEKCIEIGVDKIVPLKCRFSERKEIKIERLDKIAVSAMKQSLKALKPVISDMTPIERFITAPFDGQKFIAYCGKEVERRLFAKEYVPFSNVMILIGPEGDFSQQEVALALNNGFIPVSLGDSRLRTETAAVFACMSVHAINQRNR